MTPALVVADATVLIALAKIKALDVLKATHGNVLVGPAVKAEVVDRGKEVGAADALEVEQAIRQGWLQVAVPTHAEQELATAIVASTNLHAGEAEGIALARERRLLLIADERAARMTAAAHGVTATGTVGAILEAYAASKIDYQEFERLIQAIAEVLWLSPAVLAEILRRGSEVKR